MTKGGEEEGSREILIDLGSEGVNKLLESCDGPVIRVNLTRNIIQRRGWLR